MISPVHFLQRQPAAIPNVQFATAQFRNPPLLSVPNLMRPVPPRVGSSCRPAASLPQTPTPAVHNRQVLGDDWRAQRQRALRQRPSSTGELMRQFETTVLRQQSMSIPSRFVSIVTLSTVTLSQPVSSTAKCPRENRHIAQNNIAAAFQRDGLVPQFNRPLANFPVVHRQAAAVDHARPRDGHIRQVLAPDEAVVKYVCPPS